MLYRILRYSSGETAVHSEVQEVHMHLKEAFGQRSIGDITADDIEHYLRRRLQARVQIRTTAGVTQRDRLKPTTVHQELRVLRRMMNVAVRKAFKKYSQMKLQMKREALQKLNRKANEDRPGFVTAKVN